MAPQEVSRPGGRAARMVRNTLSNSVGKVVVLATSFVMTPFILRSVGEAEFGMWVLATVLVGYGSLLDLGMGSAIIKQVAEVHERRDVGAGRAVLGTATRLYAGLALVALAAGAVLATQAGRLVAPEEVPAGTTSAVILLATASFAVNLALTPANAALRGLQRYDLTNAITVLSALVTAVATVLVLNRGGDVVDMVAVTVPVSLLGQGATAVMLRRLSPDLALRWSPFSRSAARTLTAFGLTLTVSQLAGLLQKRTSELVVAAFLPVTAVVPFALARRLSELPHMISDQFVKVLLPVASALHASGEPGGLRRLYLASTRVTLALMLPLALCTAFLAGDLLELWVGEEYREHAPLVVLLVAASVAATSQWPAGAVFQGTGRFGWLAVTSIVTGVLTVAMTVVLVQSNGLVGAAVGSAVPSVLEAFGFVLPYAMHRLGVPVGVLVRQVVVPTALPVLPCVLVLVVAASVVDQPSWAALVVTGAVALVAYGLVYLMVPAAQEERALAGRAVRRLVRR